MWLGLSVATGRCHLPAPHQQIDPSTPQHARVGPHLEREQVKPKQQRGEERQRGSPHVNTKCQGNGEDDLEPDQPKPITLKVQQFQIRREQDWAREIIHAHAGMPAERGGKQHDGQPEADRHRCEISLRCHADLQVRKHFARAGTANDDPAEHEYSGDKCDCDIDRRQ